METTFTFVSQYPGLFSSVQSGVTRGEDVMHAEDSEFPYACTYTADERDTDGMIRDVLGELSCYERGGCILPEDADIGELHHRRSSDRGRQIRIEVWI